MHAWFASVVIPTLETWVVEVAREVVALLVIDEGWIDQLYVDPQHVRRGLGSCLVDIAKRQSHGNLDLWTFQSNVGARRFYERHGFVVVATTEGNNEESAPDMRYHWDTART